MPFFFYIPLLASSCSNSPLFGQCLQLRTLEMAMRFFRTTGAALALASIAIAVVSDTGQTVVVNGINYFALPDPVSIIDATADMLSSASTTGADLIPLTVMADPSSSFTTSVFRSLVGNYTASDDVFNIGFLQGMCSLARLYVY